MEQFGPFRPEEEPIESWLARFELWCRLGKKEKADQAGWCKLVIGQAAQTTLRLLADENDYDTVRARLIEHLGDPKPQDTATKKLSALRKGTLSCQELARQAEYLAGVAFDGAPKDVIERQALEAFLRALPVQLSREVQRVERKSVKEACAEAIRQEELLVTLGELEKEQTPAKTKKKEETVEAAQERLPPARPPRKNPVRKGACFRCGEVGHFARECPKTGAGPVASTRSAQSYEEKWKELTDLFHSLLRPARPPLVTVHPRSYANAVATLPTPPVVEEPAETDVETEALN